MRTSCFNHIPFRHYPPVVSDRCVSGATKRAIVAMFVEDATPLEQSILVSPPERPIAAIFQEPLRLWRKPIATEDVAIGLLFRTRGVVPEEGYQLKTVWKQARKTDEEVLKYDDLYQRFVSYPKVSVRQVDVHGDLHLRNILVHEKSGDILLIDFSSAGVAPASYDPATLDVSLAFDNAEDAPAGSRLSDGPCLDLYRTPLLGRPVLEGVPRRIAAILELRRQIQETATELEYELAVTGWLIWQAWRRRNATAYRCASRIVAGLGSGGA